MRARACAPPSPLGRSALCAPRGGIGDSLSPSLSFPRLHPPWVGSERALRASLPVPRAILYRLSSIYTTTIHDSFPPPSYVFLPPSFLLSLACVNSSPRFSVPPGISVPFFFPRPSFPLACPPPSVRPRTLLLSPTSSPFLPLLARVHFSPSPPPPPPLSVSLPL